MAEAADFGQPTASVTRWRVSALPSTPLPVPGVGRPRWQLELIRSRAGESADFEVEACDTKGRLALPSGLVHGPAKKESGRAAPPAEAPLVLIASYVRRSDARWPQSPFLAFRATNNIANKSVTGVAVHSGSAVGAGFTAGNCSGCLVSLTW
jgi:hypothetical protein